MILSRHMEYIGLKAYNALTIHFSKMPVLNLYWFLPYLSHYLVQPQEWRGLASEPALQTDKPVQLSDKTGRDPKPSRHRLESWQEERSRKRKEIDINGKFSTINPSLQNLS